MYLVKCSNCNFQIKDIKKVMFLFGSDVIKSELLIGSYAEKKRKLAKTLNEKNIPCPKCKATDCWTWI